MDIGAMEVNIKVDEWGKWEHDEDHDGEFDPKLFKKARLEECMQKTGKAPSHHHQVDRRRQGPGRGGADEEQVGREGFQEQERRAELQRIRRHNSAGVEERGCCLGWRVVKGSLGGNDEDGQVKLISIDVKKGHLIGKADDDDFSYIKLPKGGWWRCGATAAVVTWMRPAAYAWEEHYAANWMSEGYERGRAAPTAFTNKETLVRVLVLGATISRSSGGRGTSRRSGRRWPSGMTSRSRGMMGLDAGDDKEIRILNLGFDENAKCFHMATAKDYDAEGGEDDEELDAHEAWRYRKMAATINYLASDRLDLQFTASMLGRTMARPTTRSWSNFKKAARYLKYHDVDHGRGVGVGGLLRFRLGGVQEEPLKHERQHDCGRRRRHQVVVEPSSHGGSVVWRGRVLLGRESRSGVDRHQVDDEGHGLGRGHQGACRCDWRPGDGRIARGSARFGI